MVNIKGKGDINGNKVISGGSHNSIDSHSVDGNQNTLLVDNNITINMPRSFLIKEGLMYQLLDNIGNLPTLKSNVRLPDLVPYTIEDKISYNKLEVYSLFFDDFQDGNYIIKDKIALIEKSSNANFGNNICIYIQGKFREAFLELGRVAVSEGGDCLIERLKLKINLELKEHYQDKLSPEELVYIDYVIYYVFTECKIFKKPPQKPC